MKVVVTKFGSVVMPESETDLQQKAIDEALHLISIEPYWLRKGKEEYAAFIDSRLVVALSDYHLDSQSDLLAELTIKKAEIKAAYPKTMIEAPPPAEEPPVEEEPVPEEPV